MLQNMLGGVQGYWSKCWKSLVVYKFSRSQMFVREFHLVRIIVLKCCIINVLIVQSPYLLTTNTVKGASKSLLTFLINFGDIDSFGTRGIRVYSILSLPFSFIAIFLCHFLSVPVVSLPLQSCNNLSMSLTTWSASIPSRLPLGSTCSGTPSISRAVSWLILERASASILATGSEDGRDG